MRYQRQQLRSGGTLATCVVRVVLFLTILALVLCQVSCKEAAAAQDLAKAGAATADALAAYYDSLVQDTIDIIEFEAFISSMRGVQYTDEDQKVLEHQIDSLNARSRMARALSSAYGAFGNLANYKTDTSITPAAKDLGDALKGVKELPQSNIDPSQYIGQAATKLVEWKQARDIHRANEMLLVSVVAMETLFAKETDAYRSISEERSNKVNDILKYLIGKDKVSAWPLLDRVPKSLGLSWSGNQNAVADDATKKALIALASARERRLALISANVADDLKQSLAQIGHSHEELRDKKSPVMSTVDELIAKARAGLAEIAGIRETPATSAKEK